MVLVGVALFGTSLAFSSGAVSASTDMCGFAIDDTIAQKIAELGGIDQLGCPTSDTSLASDWKGIFNHFTSGSAIYWKSSEAGAEPHLVMGAIRNKWEELGWEQSGLGYPTTDESTTPDGVGRYNHFDGGSIYWSPDTGAHEVRGLIWNEWASLGFEQSGLGYPTSDETGTPDGVGRFNGFQGGAIYWTPDTGAHEIQGAIWDKYASLGWETSALGYPTTDESTTPDGVGRYNHFQGGSIYWTPDTGAQEIQGAIRDKWASMGWEQSSLGYPTGDETVTRDGLGSYNEFQNGSIYWSPDTGAHPVEGVIKDKYKEAGWEAGLGFPMTDETVAYDGVGHYMQFQNGEIISKPSLGILGAHVLETNTRDFWIQHGSLTGDLGYPIADERPTPAFNAWFVDFEDGVLVRDWATNEVHAVGPVLLTPGTASTTPAATVLQEVRDQIEPLFTAADPELFIRSALTFAGPPTDYSVGEVWNEAGNHYSKLRNRMIRVNVPLERHTSVFGNPTMDVTLTIEIGIDDAKEHVSATLREFQVTRVVVPDGTGIFISAEEIRTKLANGLEPEKDVPHPVTTFPVYPAGHPREGQPIVPISVKVMKDNSVNAYIV